MGCADWSRMTTSTALLAAKQATTQSTEVAAAIHDKRRHPFNNLRTSPL
jgi:hypothetical protein